MERVQWSRIKTYFDYEIPIAEVQKAGISTTGAVIENELIPLAEEFTAYRKAANLWGDKFKAIEYPVIDGTIFRMIANEREVFYE